MISAIGNLPLVGQLHFLVGVICLLAGAAAFMVRKGRHPHRLAGRVFAVCMLLLCASGLYMSLSRSILFTAFLALLAGHAVTTGWMAAARITGLAERVAAGAISLVAIAAAGSGLLVANLPSGTLNDQQAGSGSGDCDKGNRASGNPLGQAGDPGGGHPAGCHGMPGQQGEEGREQD